MSPFPDIQFDAVLTDIDLVKEYAEPFFSHRLNGQPFEFEEGAPIVTELFATKK